MARLVAEISLAKPYHSALLYAVGRGPRSSRSASAARRPTRRRRPCSRCRATPTCGASRCSSSGFAVGARAAVRQAAPVQRAALGRGRRGGARRRGAAAGLRAPRRAPARKLRVLVADDNPTNREVIGKILERSGHAVTLVNDGEQALDAIERDALRLVILDRNMPGMGGMEALQALRLMTRGPRAPAGDHAFGRRHARGEARGARGRRRRLPVQADRGAAPARRDPARSPRSRRRSAPQAPKPPAALARMPAAAGAGRGQRRDARPPRGARLLARVRGEADPRVPHRQRARILERIEQVLAGRDYHEFRSLVHAMKGSSASMGTDRLTRAVRQPRQPVRRRAAPAGAGAAAHA